MEATQRPEQPASSQSRLYSPRLYLHGRDFCMSAIVTDIVNPEAAGAIGDEAARRLAVRLEMDHDVLFVFVNVQGGGAVGRHNQCNRIALDGLEHRRSRREPPLLNPQSVGPRLRLTRRLGGSPSEGDVHPSQQNDGKRRDGDRTPNHEKRR